MSESEAKDALPLEAQNGGSEVGSISVEKPVEEDPLAVLESAVKVASLEKSEILNESDDKLDEFSRLELEMAELDKTDNVNAENSSACTIGSLEKLNEKSSAKLNMEEDIEINNSKQKTDESTPITRQNGQNSETTVVRSLVKGDMGGNQLDQLDHEDLIAVLKGDSIEKPIENEKPKKLEVVKETPPPIAPENDSDLLIKGVTIEGEGEYQIMEVIDDIEDEAESILPSTSKLGSACVQPNKKSNTSSQKLTPEEERAMAMEQIAGLNARVPRRRKQDIKTLQCETSELLSTLGADWSEDDDDATVDGERPTSSKNAAAIKHAKVGKKESTTKLQSSAEEVTSTAGDSKLEATTGAAKKRRTSISSKVTSVVVLKPAAEDAANELSTNTADNVSTSTPEPTGSTGFKRTRTIKRRIIWDPDAPETNFSYAKLVRNNAKDRPETVSLVVVPKPRSVTPKEVMPGEKRGTKRAATPLQSVATKSTPNESGQKTENLNMPSTSKQARRSQTISPDVSSTGSSIMGAKKKKISEIDRLMGDEGAANMLNSLESGRGKSGDDSDNKPHKPLMRNRSGVSEKVNKKEKDVLISVASGSTPKTKRGPKPKASTSWDYVYQKKQELSEDSMIIRRRSNSSYSSNASQHRLSVDGPTGLPAKSNARSSEVSSDDANDSSTSETPRKSPTKAGMKNVNNVADEESLSSNLNKSANATGNKVFEFAKPKDAKSNQKTPNRRTKSNATTTNTLANDIKKGMPKRGPGRPSASDRLTNSEQTTAQSTASNGSSTIAIATGEDVCVRKVGKIAHILFNMNAAQISCTFTPQLMNKIVSALNNLAEDVSCHVVVVTTNSPNFCQGIDISNLATGSVDQRKSAAIVLATATKNFLRTLATFPKPLVAGIHGTVIGLGVIQLPLFDVVIASDKTSFETPYAKIGQTPEGFCIWQSLSNVRETTKTKLLWLAEKMYSTEASTSGLIDKLTTVERVNDDAMNIAKKLSAMSTETYRYMKDFIVQKRSDAIKSSLDDEFDKITTQWTSTECFNKFKKTMEAGHF